MKVGILLNANIYYNPYLNSYSKILDELKISYDILAWDRANIGEKGAAIFKKEYPYGTGKKIRWFINHYSYSRFLRAQIIKNQYDRLVIFGPQVGLFLYIVLKEKYSYHFCFDFRDIFIEQLFPKLFKRFLKLSSLNVISSSGFISYLPKGFEYTLSHNIDIDILNDRIYKMPLSNDCFKLPIKVVTIGTLRHYEQNYQIMSALANNKNFTIKFIGSPANECLKLQQDAIKNQLSNVEFIGFYQKKDESSFFEDADFINIFFPTDIAGNTAMSNRFYSALLYKKPIITTKGTIQGMYVEKYNLGLVIEDCSNLENRIKEFVLNFNQAEFNRNCDKLLIEFRNDYQIFKEKFIEFIT